MKGIRSAAGLSRSPLEGQRKTSLRDQTIEFIFAGRSPNGPWSRLKAE